MYTVDLHTHSTFSDGTLSPKEIVELAERIGLKGVALTDHDTIDGLDEFLSVDTEIELVPGLEISCQHKNTLHMLGYYIDRNNSELLETLWWLRKKREERNQKIVERLKELGMKVSLEELMEEAGGEVVGRPHIASLLVKKGYVSHMKEAFERYLKKGGPAYFDKVRLSPERAIGLIKRAKGIPVLAHPVSLGLDPSELKDFLIYLKSLGLEGIEVIYPEHTSEDIAFFRSLAKKLSLLETGGTDFHGENKEGIELGMLEVPYEFLKRLKERAEETHEANKVLSSNP